MPRYILSNGVITDDVTSEPISWYRQKGKYQMIITPSGVPFMKQLTTTGACKIVDVFNPLGITHSVDYLPINLDITTRYMVTTDDTSTGINGYSQNNKVKFTQMNQIMTHNSTGVSFCKETDSILQQALSSANQSMSVYGQFRYGVRAFKIPLHLMFGELYVSHGPAIFDPRRIKWIDFCRILTSILIRFPDTILTVLLDDQTLNDPVAVQEFNKGIHDSGLYDSMFFHGGMTSWVVEDLVRFGHKVCMFSDTLQGERVVSTYNLVRGSDWTIQTVDDLLNEPIPKTWLYAPANKIHIMGHNITPKWWLGGSPKIAEELNSNVWDKYKSWNDRVKVDIVSFDFIQLGSCEAFFFHYKVQTGT